MRNFVLASTAAALALCVVHPTDVSAQGRPRGANEGFISEGIPKMPNPPGPAPKRDFAGAWVRRTHCNWAVRLVGNCARHCSAVVFAFASVVMVASSAPIKTASRRRLMSMTAKDRLLSGNSFMHGREVLLTGSFPAARG